MTELEEEYGKFIYQIELRDPKGLKWDLELNAVDGEVLRAAMALCERDEGAAVADMTVIVDGDATHIHAHLARVDRFEFFFLTSECVVYLQHLMTTACE